MAEPERGNPWGAAMVQIVKEAVKRFLIGFAALGLAIAAAAKILRRTKKGDE